MLNSLKQILLLTSATSPALVTAQLNQDPTYGTIGFGYGRPPRQQFFVRTVRAGGSTMTGVTYQIQGCRDTSIATPIWIPILHIPLSDSSATAVQSTTVSANAGAGNEAGVIAVG